MDASQQLRISTTWPTAGPGSCPERYVVEGELDAATAPLVDALVEPHGPLVVDLERVSFLDAAGISALVRLVRRGEAGGWSVRLANCSAPVERVLRLVDLYDRLTGSVALAR